MSLALAWRVSRFRFWSYLLGTFLVGYVFGVDSLHNLASPVFIFGFFFFSFPANFFLYGVNDYFDRDTDRLNPKKGSKEHLLKDSELSAIKFWLAACLVLALTFGMFLDTAGKVLLLLFLLLSVAYSAPPLRFKARPLLDFSSNILYGVPAVLGYHLATGALVPLWALGLVFCWTSAMHLFSAIPDIRFDKSAGLKTSAVVLNYSASLFLCSLFWTIIPAVLLLKGYLLLSLASLIYPLISFSLLFVGRAERVYWLFPWLNALMGFVLFVYAFAQ